MRGFMTVALLLVLACSAWAQLGLSQGAPEIDPGSATQAFHEANALYADEQYDAAADLYEAILDGGFENADVYYNLGNAHYKSGRLGPAVLAYERALKIDPSHEDAAANLAFMGEILADRRAPVGGALSELLSRLSTWFSAGRLTALTSLFYFILFGALVLVVIFGARLPWARSLAVAMAVVVVVSGGLLVFRAAQARSSVGAVVLAEEVGVRTGPGVDFILEFRLHEGTEVRLRESRATDEGLEWARISVSGTDLEGWLPAEAIERI
jgi:tetratricopeptide (TPR) repeat protein